MQYFYKNYLKIGFLQGIMRNTSSVNNRAEQTYRSNEMVRNQQTIF